jgi:hypothetical protein
MRRLVTLSDIQEIKPLARSTDLVTKVDIAIDEAQEYDVCSLIGQSFFLEILENTESFKDLLNEKNYTYQNRRYQNCGLKKVIALYAYRRLKNDMNEHDTAYGTMIKTNPYSQGISEATKVRQLKEIESQALSAWGKVRHYLDVHRESYPLWQHGMSCDHSVVHNGQYREYHEHLNGRKSTSIYGTR